MKIIKCLSEKIEDELKDAEEYIELAMRWKSEEPDTADLFYELSAEEMNHMMRLHEQAEKLIEDYREENGEPPREMMTLYEYLHEKHKGKATEIKVKQGMYKMQE